MEKGHEIVNDTKLDAKSSGGNATADFGGDLAKDEGIDLNSTDTLSKASHAEQFRGHFMDAMRGGASWSADNPPQAHTNPYIYTGQMAFGQRESLGQAAYHGSAAYMEEAANQHGHPGRDYQDALIQESIPENPDAALPSGEPIFDGETGIDLTDERLQGYESLEDVPPEVLDEIRGNESAVTDAELSETDTATDDGVTSDVDESDTTQIDSENADGIENPAEEDMLSDNSIEEPDESNETMTDTDDTEDVEQSETDNSNDNDLDLNAGNDELEETPEMPTDSESEVALEQPEIEAPVEDIGVGADEFSEPVTETESPEVAESPDLDTSSDEDE